MNIQHHQKNQDYINQSLVILVILSLFGLSGCVEYDRKASQSNPPTQEDPILFLGNVIGETCSSDSPCRRGLECEDKVCTVMGESTESTPCLVTAECQDGLRCGWTGFCVEEGSQNEGQNCGHDGECKRGFTCERLGGIAG
jgi:hypothetical protein